MANIFKFRVTTKVENTIGLGIGNYSAEDTIYLNEKQLNTASFRNAIQKGYLEPAGEDDSQVSSVMMDYYNGSQNFGKNYFPAATVELVQPIAAASIVNTQPTDLCGDMLLGKRVAVNKILAKFTTASVTAAMPRLLVVAGDSSPVTPTVLITYTYLTGAYLAATNGSIAHDGPITWAASDMLIIGYTEKFASVVCDMTTANSRATLAVPYYWDGSAWAAFPAYHDYTVETATKTMSRAAALDKTRMVWWDKPDNWTVGGPAGSGAASTDYCVAIKFDGAFTGLEGASFYPVLDTPIADIRLGTNEWIPKAIVLKIGTTYSDITSSAPATLNNLAALTDYIWFGFNQKVSSIRSVTTAANTNASVIALTYWNGTAWTACPTVTDGTISGGCSLGQTGTISMANVPEDWAMSAVTNSSSGFPGVNNIPSTITTDKLYWLRYSVTVADIDAGTSATFSTNTGQPTLNRWYEYNTVDNAFIDADDAIKVIVTEPENTIAGLTIQAMLEDI